MTYSQSSKIIIKKNASKFVGCSIIFPFVKSLKSVFTVRAFLFLK